MEQYPKYRASEPVAIENRVWPTRRITRPPAWVSVDLRDGNQAFARPMNVATKIRYFQMLTQIGFKEIEVAYPASSAEEFEFVRRLIAENLIPDDVRISVLTAARENLIARTIESLQGVRQATIHCYVATSDLHREFVFHKTEAEITEMAVSATKMIAEALEQNGMRDAIHYEFSPEEFSDSRLGFIVDLASAGPRRVAAERQGGFHPEPSRHRRAPSSLRVCRHGRSLHPELPVYGGHHLERAYP